MNKDSTKKPTKGKSKGRPRFRGTNKEREPKSETTKTGCANDPRWYLVNGQLAKDVASLNFNQALGSAYHLSSAEGADYKSSVPGIMAIGTVPTVGYTHSEYDPINVAAQNIYSYVRHANSGHANYERTDLMIYLMAMDSICTYWAWMVRLYGLLNMFSQKNRYVGDALVQAACGNPTDLRQKLAQFRAYINMYAVKASAFAIPNTMSIFTRHMWMYSNVYKDEDVAKSQFYLYNPAFLYTFELDPNGVGMLRCVPVAATINTSTGAATNGYRICDLARIITVGDLMLQNLLNQEDIGIMSGDIIKAYGADKLWKFGAIDENFVTMPIFSEEVLAQIHNTSLHNYQMAGIVPASGGGLTGSKDVIYLDKTKYPAWAIYQDVSVGHGYLIHEPGFLSCGSISYDKILDVWKEEVTPEDVLVMSRLTNAGQKDPSTTIDGKSLWTCTVCGSEIATMAHVFTLDTNGNLTVSVVDQTDGTPLVGNYFNFNEYPINYICTSSGALTSIICEMSNYKATSRQELMNLHETCLLSEFGVPYTV